MLLLLSSHSTFTIRLLRQHRYHISQGLISFYIFLGLLALKTRKKSFTLQVYILVRVAKGVLSLHEAYYLSFEGESIMEAAWSFTFKMLREILRDITDQNLSMKVRHALEFPLNWRMPRLEASWYIDFYRRSNNMNPALLELAKLDYKSTTFGKHLVN